MAADSASVQELGSGSAVISGVGGNVFATRGDDGLVLVDTGRAANVADLFGALERQFGDTPMNAAFNTHWHYDHTGGNPALRDVGARIFAHENTRLWLGGDFDVPWENRHYDPLPERALPTDTFYMSGSTVLGGRTVEYRHFKRAHTDGDICVVFPDADVIVAGDLVSVGSYPVLDYATGGWIGEMTEAVGALVEMAGPETRIVPGTGPVVGREHLAAQYEMLIAVRDRLYALLRQGRSAQEMLDARVTAEFDVQWGDPTMFVLNAYPGMWSHSSAVGGIV